MRESNSLNTGLTSLITFGRKLPQAVSTITTTHELGHNFGSEVHYACVVTGHK